MQILLIEDEIPARAKLNDMLKQLDPQCEMVAQLGSVKESLVWLRTHTPPDIAFVDIQLSDDHSFEIFKQHDINFPIVFTTAYDKYLLESFEFNSIDYLLKPITLEKLKRSLEKVKKLEKHFSQSKISKLLQSTGTGTPYTRIIAKKGTEYAALEVNDIAYFFTEHKLVFVKDFSGRQLIIDKNLTELEILLDKSCFFRLNRKFITNIKSIDRFKPDNGKIRIFLKPELKQEVFVSKETAPEFRQWIEGKQ